MCNREIWPNVITYSAVISACEKGGADYTDTALQLFDEMRQHGVGPDVITYSAAISACEKGGAGYTKTALQLFDEMKENGVNPNNITYNALISACGRGGTENVDIALRHFDEMQKLGIHPDKITYTAITKACYDNQIYPEAMETTKEAVSKGLVPTLGTNAKEWDLHEMREAQACMLVADALISSVKSASFRDILLITGRGKQSRSLRNADAVLQVKVPAFLKDLAGLELAEHIQGGKVNEGAFGITKKALQKWAKSDDFIPFQALMTGKGQ